MSQVCHICRKPGADIDPRVLFPDLDVRQHRLLDRAIHGGCYSGWTYRKQFSAEFHEVARQSGRPDLTLADNGTLYEGLPPIGVGSPFRKALAERLQLVPFRGKSLRARFRHYRNLMQILCGLLFVLALVAFGTFLTIMAWPYGLLVGGILYVTAWIVVAQIWQWSPMLLSQRASGWWWLLF